MGIVNQEEAKEEIKEEAIKEGPPAAKEAENNPLEATLQAQAEADRNARLLAKDSEQEREKANVLLRLAKDFSSVNGIDPAEQAAKAAASVYGHENRMKTAYQHYLLFHNADTGKHKDEKAYAQELSLKSTDALKELFALASEERQKMKKDASFRVVNVQIEQKNKHVEFQKQRYAEEVKNARSRALPVASY